MFATRTIATTASRRWLSSPKGAVAFHNSSRQHVQVGDRLPNVDLVEDSPGNKVNLAKEVKGKGVIIGVPAAFSPSCSAKHIPGYLAHKSLRDAGDVFVVSVNDPFVMKAWREVLDPESRSKIRFLGDPHGEFTEQLELAFDATAIFGQRRSKRYALLIEDGKVMKVHVEPDNTGVNVSSAENVLG